MSKWADYCITRVRYTKGIATMIELVEVRKFVNNKLEKNPPLRKQEVINLIKDGFTFCTVIRNESGEYEKGDDVEFIPSKFTKGYYIKTVGNETDEDNLGDLPTF